MENNLNSQSVTILKCEKIYISKNSSNKENENFNKNSSNEFEEEVHFVKIIKREFEEKTVKVWECGTCNKDFSHNYTLIRHLRTHSEARCFKCQECGKSFRQLSTLTQHKATHSIERPFVCDVCDRSFNRISTLISHKKIHTENKPYICEYCDKSFHQKGNLKNHLFIHTNARPYMCDLCKRGFNQMSNLVCHQKKFHPKDNSTIWSCSICCMGFKKQSALRTHELKEHPKNKQPEQLEIEIPAIKTQALMKAKANNEIPFALLHLIHGKILIVRIIDSGDSSLIKEASKQDFKLLQNSENSKITLPMVADIHQKNNEDGSFEYIVRPPDTSFNFLNENADEPVIEPVNEVSDEDEEIDVVDEDNGEFTEVFEFEKTESSDIEPMEPVVVPVVVPETSFIDEDDNGKFLEPFKLPEQVFELAESADIKPIEPVVVSEISTEIVNSQPPVDEINISGSEAVNEDLSFLTYAEYMSLIDAIYSGGYEPDFEGINNFFSENNISLNF